MNVIRSLGRFVVYVIFFSATWFLNFLICGILGSLYYDGTNEAIGAIYGFTMLLVPAIASTIETIAFKNKWNQKRETKTRANVKPPVTFDKSKKVPFTKKKQTALAAEILANIEICVSLANKSDTVSLFVEWYDEAIDGFRELIQLDKVKFQSPPSLDYYKFQDEFQWHLCDAVVRAKEKTISDIKNKYKNSHEFQIRAADTFERDINSVRDRFSMDTATLVAKAIAEIQNAAGIYAHTPSSPPENHLDQFSKYGGIQDDLLAIDLMEGHDFEHWCAKLLTDIGYTNVSVTKASGDQGVDVLAQKDGIRYAIQCKCYSRDLDNKPVQEVNAGRKMPEYHCQIGVVMTNRYFTQSAKDLATATGVLLWDRDWIQKAIQRRNNTEV